MEKLLYRYNPDTGEYVGSFPAALDTVATKLHGYDVYLSYSDAVDEPPPVTGPNEIAVYKPGLGDWEIVPDYRGTTVYDVDTSEAKVWRQLGELPTKYIIDAPREDLGEYQWIDPGPRRWVADTRRYQELCDVLWSRIKRLRDLKCDADLEYNGHWYHVDKKSMNDLLLAVQAGEVTMRWVTADSVNVTLAHSDFVAILQAYADRRAGLVYKSNDDWTAMMETDPSMVELVAKLREVNAEIAKQY